MENSFDQPPVLLYDGVCGFCNRAVKLLLEHDRRRRTMRFAPVQSDFGQQVIARHPELANVDSVIYLESSATGDERVSVRSDAALRCAGYLGGAWNVFRVAAILPRAVRDFFYDQFAKRRYRWFGKYDTCMLPSADARSRFVDLA